MVVWRLVGDFITANAGYRQVPISAGLDLLQSKLASHLTYFIYLLLTWA